MNNITSKLNVPNGTSYEVIQTANLKNLAIQYKLEARGDDTVEIQFWGTVYSDADDNTQDDWVNITFFLTEREQVIADLETIHELSLIDSGITFAKIKIVYIVTSVSADNKIKVGWNSNE